MRPEPSVAQHQFRRCLAKHERARKRRAAQFGHARDVHSADPPGQELACAHLQSPTARWSNCLKLSLGRLRAADDASTQARDEAVPGVWVLHDLSAVERRTRQECAAAVALIGRRWNALDDGVNCSALMRFLVVCILQLDGNARPY